MFDFWKVQSDKLLFPEIEWNRPEQKTRAGKLLIIGGGAGQFRSLALAYETAIKTGVGQVKVIAPDSLKKTLKIDQLHDIFFVTSNNSGGFSIEVLKDLKAGEKWADSILLIGDTNKSSETAVLFEKFILETEKPILITRDSIDILMNSFVEILNKPNITIFASYAQLQKIFSSVFYPKILTFSLPLLQVVEIIHKFTLSFESQIVTFHAESLIMSKNGKVFSCPQNSQISKGKISPLRIWSGEIPTRTIVWQTWNPEKPLEASITGVVA